MAPEKFKVPSVLPVSIGDCEVVFEAGRITYESKDKELRISTSKNSTIKIYVKDVFEKKNEYHIGVACNRATVSLAKERSISQYTFDLLNPKDKNNSCSYHLQEVLKIYKDELPAMNYAANTGKESKFLNRCVSSGKYSTLVLKLKQSDKFEKVIGGITYQLVPSDTRYAEVPLAAVSSQYQRKGFGCILFAELRSRLNSVGVRTIYCWGDEESKNFWQKQGFSCIAEVDSRGRARKFPIKADIRRALCFPGGSTLMVCQLESKSWLESLNPHQLYPQNVAIPQHPSFIDPCTMAVPNAETGSIQILEESSKDEKDFAGLSQTHGSEEPTSRNGASHRESICCLLMEQNEEATRGNCSNNTAVVKKRVWESSCSSLKTKKVKGTHEILSDTCCFGEQVSGADKVVPTMGDPLSEPLDKSSRELGAAKGFTCKSGTIIHENTRKQDLQASGNNYRILLMNIADDAKKSHLLKVIGKLGGFVTNDGTECTHVVTGKVRATSNFCFALSNGAWILSSCWLKESFRQGRFIDEAAHVLSDEDYRMKFGIELKVAVWKAKEIRGSLFKGYTICIAKHAYPPFKTLSAIVRCAGGNAISGLRDVEVPWKTIYIACEENIEEALLAANKGLLSFGSDWLINCVLRQDLDLHAQQFTESLS